MKIGYAPGAFDMFHVGHLNLLRQAKFHCDFLIAGVISDEAFREMRGKTPIIPFEERLAIVRSVQHVDFAVCDQSLDKIQVWQTLHFDVLVKGDDWKTKPEAAQLIAGFADRGIEIVYVPYSQQNSSTRLRQIIDEIESRR